MKIPVVFKIVKMTASISMGLLLLSVNLSCSKNNLASKVDISALPNNPLVIESGPSGGGAGIHFQINSFKIVNNSEKTLIVNKIEIEVYGSADSSSSDGANDEPSKSEPLLTYTAEPKDFNASGAKTGEGSDGGDSDGDGAEESTAIYTVFHILLPRESSDTDIHYESRSSGPISFLHLVQNLPALNNRSFNYKVKAIFSGYFSGEIADAVTEDSTGEQRAVAREAETFAIVNPSNRFRKEISFQTK